ncbi:MAG: hypothetical protein IJ040_07155 [Lachnospiraceae bacterium]|nr:hypothetical protein [Lachnospiraceae bacterium]
MQIAIFLFYVLYFRVICESGLSADDMWNSNIQAERYLAGTNAWELTWNQFGVWLKLGRVFPFSNYMALLFYLVPSVAAYKACILGTTWINSVICGFCVRSISKSDVLQYLFMLLFPLFLQLTPEFDSGLYCYHMLIQMVVLWCFLSLWCLLKYQEKKKKIYAILSPVLFFLALGTYEVAFVFMFAILWVILLQEKKWTRALKLCLPNLIVFLGMGIANVIARLFIQESTYQGISIHISIQAIVVTLLKQCSTCFPLGRYICSGLRYCDPYSDVYPYTMRDILAHIQVWDILAIILFIACIWFVFSKKMLCKSISTGEKAERSEKQELNHLTIIGLGLIVFIFPGMLIAVSSKYQQVLGWCSGHLPAYMQSIGVAIVVADISYLIIQRVQKKMAAYVVVSGCVALATCIIILNLVSGRAGVEYMNGFRKYPQDTITNAAEAGFFDEIENRDDRIVFGTTTYIYDNNNVSAFYSKFARRRILASTREDVASLCMQQLGVLDVYDMRQYQEKEYYGIFNMAEEERRALIMGRCTELELNESGTDFSHVWIENPRVYLEGFEEQEVPLEWTLVKQGMDYAIYELEGEYDIVQSDENRMDGVQVNMLYQEKR